MSHSKVNLTQSGSDRSIETVGFIIKTFEIKNWNLITVLACLVLDNRHKLTDILSAFYIWYQKQNLKKTHSSCVKSLFFPYGQSLSNLYRSYQKNGKFHLYFSQSFVIFLTKNLCVFVCGFIALYIYYRAYIGYFLILSSCLKKHFMEFKNIMNNTNKIDI